MMNLKIRTKIALWYSLFLLVLLGIFIPYVYYALSQSMYRNEEAMIRVDASQATSMIEIEDNSIKLKKAENAQISGTYISVYDTWGKVLFDSSHLTWINSAKPLYDQFQIVNRSNEQWLLYDQPIYNDTLQIAWLRAIRPLKPVNDTLYTLRVLILVALPVYIIVIVLGSLIIAGRALSPINRITMTAKGIGQGDLSKRLNMNKVEDEVGSLAVTFDAMLDRLDAAFKREKQFTSDASHELRTPIAIISAHAEESLTGNKSPTDYKEAMETILKESRKMGQMVSQLLTLTRGDEGKYKPEIENVNLSVVVHDVVNEMRNFANNSDITIYLNVRENMKINADQTLMTRLLINLIDNAIKYNKKGGWIKVSLSMEGGLAKIIVEDSGIGISEEDLPNIFERFYRADKTRVRNGTGLGLSIVKWIVEVHGGKISVASKIGEGTKFELRFRI